MAESPQERNTKKKQFVPSDYKFIDKITPKLYIELYIIKNSECYIMKKFISLCLVSIILVAFCSCGRGEEDDGKALLTADSTINVTSNAGVITLNEDVAAIMLGVFSPEHLGLSDVIESYTLKLGATKVFGKDACLVEAYAEDSDSPEGIFAILGQDCYVFKNNQYMLLTADGPVEVTTNPLVTNSVDESAGDETGASESNEATEVAQSATQPQTNPQLPSGMQYNEANDKKLKATFSSYSKETLGIEKELDEYVLVAVGGTATAIDGEKVYTVQIYEKDGTKTAYKLAISDNGPYKYNTETQKFEKLN